MAKSRIKVPTKPMQIRDPALGFKFKKGDVVAIESGDWPRTIVIILGFTVTDIGLRCPDNLYHIYWVTEQVEKLTSEFQFFIESTGTLITSRD